MKSKLKEAFPKFPSVVRALREFQSRKAQEIKQLEENLPPSSKGLVEKIVASTTEYLNELEDRVLPKRIRGMHAGGDGARPLKFNLLEVDYLPWAGLYGDLFPLAGCGPCILGGVTHTNPVEIRALMTPLVKEYFPEAMTGRMMDGLPDELMKLYFNAFGIHVIPYTLNDLCPTKGVIKAPLTERHVLLQAAHVASGATTWLIYHGKKMYHNTTVEEANYLNPLNFIPDTTYLLFNPLWRFESKAFIDFGLEPVDDS